MPCMIYAELSAITGRGPLLYNSLSNSMHSPETNCAAFLFLSVCVCVKDRVRKIKRWKWNECVYMCVSLYVYKYECVCVYVHECVACQPAARTQITEERAILTENRDVINPTGYTHAQKRTNPCTRTCTSSVTDSLVSLSSPVCSWLYSFLLSHILFLLLSHLLFIRLLFSC